MTNLVRVTSKNQITLPVNIVNSIKLKKGDTLSVKIEGDKLIMEKPQDILNSLSGSLPMPERFKGKGIDEIIDIAKSENLSKKYAKGIS